MAACRSRQVCPSSQTSSTLPVSCSGRSASSRRAFSRSTSRVTDIAWAGHQTQDAQGRLDGQHQLAQRQLQVAHDRRQPRKSEKLGRARVEDELPGHGRQVECVDPQLDAQSLAAVDHRLAAAVIDGAHVVDEQGVEELGAEGLNHLRGALAAVENRLFECCELRFKPGAIPRRRHRRATLPGRRIEHRDRIAPGSARADFDLKVAIVQDIHATH